MFTVIISLLVVYGNFLPDEREQSLEWTVPESARLVENPTDREDQDDLEYGQTLFSQHCKSCHGKNGLGDGSASKNLETPVPNFSMNKFQKQTDGSIFYKMSTGRNEMPEFRKKIPENEDRWLIVNYIRTLATDK